MWTIDGVNVWAVLELLVILGLFAFALTVWALTKIPPRLTRLVRWAVGHVDRDERAFRRWRSGMVAAGVEAKREELRALRKVGGWR